MPCARPPLTVTPIHKEGSNKTNHGWPWFQIGFCLGHSILVWYRDACSQLGTRVKRMDPFTRTRLPSRSNQWKNPFFLGFKRVPDGKGADSHRHWRRRSWTWYRRHQIRHQLWLSFMLGRLRSQNRYDSFDLSYCLSADLLSVSLSLSFCLYFSTCLIFTWKIGF